MSDGSFPTVTSPGLAFFTQLQKLSDLQNHPGKKGEKTSKSGLAWQKGNKKQESGSVAKSLVADPAA